LEHEILDFQESKKCDIYREEGLDILPEDLKKKAMSIVNRLKEFGIFIIPNGAVESWLKNLGIQTEKKAWLIDVLQKIEDESIQPEQGDIWQFISEVSTWISKKDRLGMH
jgi:hypothetical protein